jgi:transcriptional regulator with XRE-family HTH domain
MELALAAKVSPRQLSFIETGRGRPTRATLERLADVLSISHRERAFLMQAAGVVPQAVHLTGEPTFSESVARALEFLLEQHEPYPAWVIDRYTNLSMQNHASELLLPLLLSPGYLRPGRGLNLIRMLFDPDGVRPRLADWSTLARTALLRLELAVVADPHDTEMRALRDYVLASDADAVEWTRGGVIQPLDPIVPLGLRMNGLELKLVTAFTMLATPDGLSFPDFYVQTFFPADEESRSFLSALAPEDERPRRRSAPREG